MSVVRDFISETMLTAFDPVTDYVIFVQTGDRKDADTDAYVYIRLFDDSGNASDRITLNNVFKNDFKRGQTDMFNVSSCSVEKLKRDGHISRIELWKDDVWKADDWYVDKVVVENRTNNSASVFPVFRWLKNEYLYNIVNYDTSLPQDDPFKEQREMELKEKRQNYVYAQKKPGGGPVQVHTMPEDEKFSFAYQFDISSTTAKLQKASQIIVGTHDEWSSIEDIRSIYTKSVFDTPKGIDQWNSDLYFGIKRLASLNPALIERVTKIPDKFPVSDQLLQPLLDGMTICQAIADNRLFLCDFHMLDGMVTKEGFVVCSPIGLFFLNKLQQFKPVAIQLYQKPGPDNPIFTPKCPPLTWELAKMWYNNADATLHQGVTHLGMTHLLMEGVAVASHRNLSPSHPIFKVLAPHFLYLIAINNLAVETLISDGGWVDRVMSSGARGLVYLYNAAIKTWRMDVDGNLREDLKRRGMDDPDVLPQYVYRDDALLLYGAIEKYARAYVKLYYPNDDILKADYEIQNWAQELVKERNGSSGGVGLLGVPGNGELTKGDQLAEILTCVIYTCSVTHAAVNFPQYEEYGFPINYPLLLRGKPPNDATFEATEQDILKAAPAMMTTLDIMTITTVLSGQGTNSLGDFEVQYVCDPKAVKIIGEFRRDLTEVSKEIKRRNLHSRLPAYEFLHPENIPNSISV